MTLQSAVARCEVCAKRFEVAMLEGDADRAEQAARETCETAEAIAERGNFSGECESERFHSIALEQRPEAHGLPR